MATFSFTSTAAQDAAVKRIVASLNAANQTLNPSAPTITALQWITDLINHWLDARVAEFAETDNISKAEAYQKASVADKATIDSILAKYQ